MPHEPPLRTVTPGHWKFDTADSIQLVGSGAVLAITLHLLFRVILPHILRDWKRPSFFWVLLFFASLFTVMQALASMYYYTIFVIPGIQSAIAYDLVDKRLAIPATLFLFGAYSIGCFTTAAQIFRLRVVTYRRWYAFIPSLFIVICAAIFVGQSISIGVAVEPLYRKSPRRVNMLIIDAFSAPVILLYTASFLADFGFIGMIYTVRRKFDRDTDVPDVLRFLYAQVLLDCILIGVKVTSVFDVEHRFKLWHPILAMILPWKGCSDIWFIGKINHVIGEWLEELSPKNQKEEATIANQRSRCRAGG